MYAVALLHGAYVRVRTLYTLTNRARENCLCESNENCTQFYNDIARPTYRVLAQIVPRRRALIVIDYYTGCSMRKVGAEKLIKETATIL